MPNPSYAAVTFTEKKNLDFLEVSLPTWGASRTFLVAQEEIESTHPSSECLITEFPRGVTLNGKECAIGVLQTLRQLARDNLDTEYLLKVDDDMLRIGSHFEQLMGSGQFHSIGQEIVRTFRDPEGNKIGQHRFTMGGAYILSTEILRRLPESPDDISELLDIVNEKNGGVISAEREQGYSWPEDEAVSAVAVYLTQAGERAWLPDLLPFGFSREWNFSRYREIKAPELRRCRAFDFVHMRGLHHFTGTAREEAQQICLSTARDLVAATRATPI